VILSCPACATRYRHEGLPVGSPARCGQCDRVFPVPPGRAYFVETMTVEKGTPASRRLVAAAAVAGPFHGARPAPVVAAPVALPPVLPPVSDPAPAVRDEASLDPLGLRLPSDRGRDLERRSAPRSEPAPEPASAPRAAWIPILGGAAAGTCAALVLQLVLGGPMRIWAAAGAALGCISGWGWRRWMSARS